MHCLVTESEYSLVVINLFFFKSELKKILQSFSHSMFKKLLGNRFKTV